METDTKKIRRKLYISYFQDGLWDIVLGIFLLSWGITVWFNIGWLPGVTFVAFFWLALGLKQKITYPRIGYAKPADQRQQLLRIVITGIVTLLLGLIVFLIIFTDRTPQFVDNYFELIFGGILAIAVGLIGSWFGISRWYAYAAMMLVSAIANQWWGLSFEFSFILPGGIILIYGLITLFRFLRKYPEVSEESFHDR
jgi:hypothetical protein